MGDIQWLIALAGVFVTLLIIIDVFLTVLHVDVDGPIARTVFHSIWKMIMVCIRFFPGTRRSLIALGGPLMITGAIAIWIGIFILGFALIYWPYIDLFRADEAYRLLGFTEALYFSGVTATVLGYGDISPLHGLLQVVSFVQSGLGFALLTGIITYLINIVSGVSDRNALSLRLWAMTDQTGDGTKAVIRSLKREEIGDFRLRLQTLLDTTHNIHQKVHQFPILDLFYRSRDPIYSPEIMLRSAMQLAIAAQIISIHHPYQRLLSVSVEFGQVTSEIIKLIAKQHMSSKLYHQLKNPVPAEEDRQQYEELRQALSEALPRLDLSESEDSDRIAGLIFRMRVFLDAADHLTGWRTDQVLEDDK